MQIDDKFLDEDAVFAALERGAARGKQLTDLAKLAGIPPDRDTAFGFLLNAIAMFKQQSKSRNEFRLFAEGCWDRVVIDDPVVPPPERTGACRPGVYAVTEDRSPETLANAFEAFTKAHADVQAINIVCTDRAEAMRVADAISTRGWAAVVTVALMFKDGGPEMTLRDIVAVTRAHDPDVR